MDRFEPEIDFECSKEWRSIKHSSISIVLITLEILSALCDSRWSVAIATRKERYVSLLSTHLAGRFGEFRE